MSTTVIAFALVGLAATGILAATLVREMVQRDILQMHSGEAHLSPQSVNWLFCAALISAVVICAVCV